MTSEDRMLLEILAFGDAIWLPFRQPDYASPRATLNLSVARGDFARSGIRWHSTGRTDAERKRSQRRFSRLAAAGLVSRITSRGVRLSDFGEARARALAGLPTILDAFIATVAVEHWAADGWVCETVLIFNRRNASYSDLKQDENWLLAHNDESFLPALSRGYVVSNSDCEGRVFFQVTEAGFNWIAAGDPELPDLPAIDPEALKFYAITCEARRKAIRNAEPARKHAVAPHALPTGAPSIRAKDGWSDPPRRRKSQKQGQTDA